VYRISWQYSEILRNAERHIRSGNLIAGHTLVEPLNIVRAVEFKTGRHMQVGNDNKKCSLHNYCLSVNNFQETER
jgi:hypothetical protein